MKNNTSICPLCSENNPLIILICSHYICLQCANVLKQLQQSTIQNKYWVQCPKCTRKTFSYDFSNLLIESHELSLLTDRSSLQQQLNESQLNIQSEPALLQRRRSINKIGAELEMELLHATPTLQMFSDSKKTPFSQFSQKFCINIMSTKQQKKDSKKLQQQQQQSSNTILQYKLLKQIHQISKGEDKKPIHKRCNTGIVDNKKNPYACYNFKSSYFNKQKTSPIKNKSTKNSTIFEYLLSLTKNEDKISKIKDISIRPEKSRCLSQIVIKQNQTKKKYNYFN